VGLVTDAGRIDDGTFNQYAYEGLMQAAEEHGLDPQVIETELPDEVEPNVRRLIDQGCNLVITVGARSGPKVEQLAMRYPEVRFVIVDHEPLPESRNVTGLLFAEDQAGFLAGALAGLVTEAERVGFIGGLDIAPVRKFQRGFKHGLAHTNRRAEVLETTTESFTDRAAGNEAARELVGHGADVVFAAAGPSGSAAI
jgi:basic membrane protein A